MSKIKVLHIIKSLGRGGAEMLLPETLKLHNQEEFEFHYIYFLPWKNQMVKSIVDAGGKVTCINSSNNLQIITKASSVIKYCRSEHIDIIHCHLPWSGFLGRIIHWKTKIPLLYTEHNIQEHYHFITKILNKFSFNYQNLALGVSEDVTKSIKQNINPTTRVETLLNGVNTGSFVRNLDQNIKIREKYKIPLNAIVIGKIAVLRKQKNFPDWIKAFKKINMESPSVYGFIIGTGPEEEEIKTLINSFQLSDKIIMAGLQTETVSFFSAIDIFMMSSTFEGLPVALLEAMSMECAIVSTKAGGVVEAVRHQKDGLLCEIGDTSCLADNALLLASNRELRVELQQAARKRVKDSFSLVVMVKKLENYYKEILRKNKKINYCAN